MNGQINYRAHEKTVIALGQKVNIYLMLMHTCFKLALYGRYACLCVPNISLDDLHVGGMDVKVTWTG